MSSTTATAERLLSPRRSDRSDGSSSEARDVLPSLPSSSSGLMFINHGTYKHPSNVDGARRRQRVPSLYGNTSTGTSDTNPIRGSSTFEYDVSSNLHRQQARRQRGDSNASISTVASAMSRSRSIADSFTSSIAAYEHDGHVHGQFVASSCTAGNDQGSIRSGLSNNLHSGGAAASLRRIGGRAAIRGAGGRNGAGGVQSEGRLNDRLESIIANSASYRAAGGGRPQGDGRLPLSESSEINGAKRPAFDGRQRKSSFASIRSLIGYSSSGAQRQTSTGAYESTISRTASLFGVYMGGGKGFPSTSSGLSSTLRSPAWAQHSRPSAPTLTTANGEKVATVGRGDALGTLKGIRGMYAMPTAAAPGRRNNVKDIFPAEQSASHAASPPQSPTLSESSDSRQVSIHAKLRKRAAHNAGASATTSTRRAFAALDPTSSSNHASGTATPRTVRSVTPPTISRASSQVDLPTMANGGSGEATPSSPTHSHDLVNSASGAMPALDAALARAEDKSGLKTSSRCTACNKRAVNAPVSRNGDVYCSRDCRIETKRKRQAAVVAAKGTPGSSTSTSTSAVSNVPPAAAVAASHIDPTSIPSAPGPVIPPSGVQSPSVAAPV